jgi:hypothetical protein
MFDPLNRPRAGWGILSAGDGQINQPVYGNGYFHEFLSQ